MITLALLGTSAIRPAAPAVACSCVRVDDRSLVEVVSSADGAFVGTVRRIDGPGVIAQFFLYNADAAYHFEVEGVAAGRIGRQVVVRAGTQGASCGLELQAGDRVGLFVSRDDDEWTSGLCSMVDADELSALAAPPDPSIGPPIDAAWPATGALVAFAAVVVALARTGVRARHDPASPEAAGS